MRTVHLLLVVLVLVMCLVTAGEAQSPRQLSVDFHDMAFTHLVGALQNTAPEATFVMGPGVADRLVTVKSARPLTVEEAAVAGSAAADVELTHVGNVYAFQLRPGAAPFPAAPQEAPMAKVALPAGFPGADTLVDLHVRDVPLAKVIDQLIAAAAPGTGRLKIVLEPETLQRILVRADFYKRPLSEVLAFLCDRAGLTYTARVTPEGAALYLVPRPSLSVNFRAVVRDGLVAFQDVKQEELPAPASAPAPSQPSS